MNTKTCRQKTVLRTSRLLVQAAALVLSLIGYGYLVRNMGLPRPVFLLLAIMAGMFFCGWCCPFGTIQEWLRRVGKSATGMTLTVPRWLDRYLSLLRYGVLLLAGLAIAETLNARHAWATLVGGGTVAVASWAVLGILLFLALFVDRPYCRYLCGFGAMHGLVSMVRVFAIRRAAHVCTGCGRCDAVCPMGVEVSRLEIVRDPHCINCFECVGVCSRTGALTAGLALPHPRHYIAMVKNRLPNRNQKVR